MKASFLICGHNSRGDLLERVVAACVAQEGLSEADEILLVDSGSSPALQVPAAGAERVRLVREEQPGLARARVCGIRHSTGEVLIFVDDDTVLYPDYLVQARRILAERPYLAAIGGQLLPEYEGPLPLPEHYYRYWLAIREFDQESWTNRWEDFAATPIGGGMVVRRAVADAWAKLCETTPWRMGMGRSGGALTGGEDRDLVHAACTLGFGVGVFPELRLTHVFPPHRLRPEFLVRIAEGNAQSDAFLRGMLNENLQRPSDTIVQQAAFFLRGLRKGKVERAIAKATRRGVQGGWDRVLRERAALATYR